MTHVIVIARSEATKQSISCPVRLDCFASLAMTLPKPHLPQHRAAGEAVRVRQRLQQFEVIIGFADDQLGRLSAACTAAKNSRVWRWNSGVSQVP